MEGLTPPQIWLPKAVAAVAISHVVVAVAAAVVAAAVAMVTASGLVAVTAGAAAFNLVSSANSAVKKDIQLFAASRDLIGISPVHHRECVSGHQFIRRRHKLVCRLRSNRSHHQRSGKTDRA